MCRYTYKGDLPSFIFSMSFLDDFFHWLGNCVGGTVSLKHYNVALSYCDIPTLEYSSGLKIQPTIPNHTSTGIVTPSTSLHYCLALVVLWWW